MQMIDKMVELVATGHSWDEVAKELGIARSTFSNLIRHNENFEAAYRAAKVECADHYVDLVMAEALDRSRDVGKSANAAVQRSKLIIDTFMRLAGKLKPRQWGDKVEVNHTGNVTVSPLQQLREIGAKTDNNPVLEAEIVEEEDCF